MTFFNLNRMLTKIKEIKKVDLKLRSKNTFYILLIGVIWVLGIFYALFITFNIQRWYMSSNKSGWNSKYKQGFYKLVNPDKYIGDPSNIKFRSSWEYAFSSYLDNNDKVMKWACEQPIISYVDLRNGLHRYYPDYYYEIKTNSNEDYMKRVIVEIKPKIELTPPIRPKNETQKALQNYEYAVRMHIKNKLKWSAAEEYAKKRGDGVYYNNRRSPTKSGSN